jgi:hypothetical protein
MTPSSISKMDSDTQWSVQDEVEKAVVPLYESSMIRGTFGRAFKESCCPFPNNGAGYWATFICGQIALAPVCRM